MTYGFVLSYALVLMPCVVNVIEGDADGGYIGAYYPENERCFEPLNTIITPIWSFIILLVLGGVPCTVEPLSVYIEG